MSSPLVSFLLVNYRTPDMTRDCIESIGQYTRIAHEIIVADNGSGDDSVERLRKECPGVSVIAMPENRGFGAGCNVAATGAKGEFLYLLNTDTLLHEDSAAILAAFLQAHPKAVAAGSRLHNKDGSYQPSAAFFPTFISLLAGRDVVAGSLYRIAPRLSRLVISFPPQAMLHAPLRVDWCVGASLMIRADTYKKIGGFDEDYFMYAEEMDLCYRLSKLGEIWFTPETSILHLDGGSQGGSPNDQRLAKIAAGHRLFFNKHYSPAKAKLYSYGMYFSALIKGWIWGLMSRLSGKASHKNKALWQKTFARNYWTVSYPLPDKKG